MQRRIERHQLPYYLKVFNRNTGTAMGNIGNLSEDGLMLISVYPMLVGALFELRLKLPDRAGGVHLVDFNARCQWSREDVAPGTFDSGFALSSAPADYLEMVEALRRYFSFLPSQVQR